VDVGCNKGDWAQCVRLTNPQADIHAIDIIEEVADVARQRFACDDKINLHAVGLGDITRKISVEYAKSKTTVTSIYPSGSHRKSEMRTVQIERADTYLSSQDIAKIDVLKIDVEGMEHFVLKGFEPLLEKRTIRLIQFEYGTHSVQSRVLLADYYMMFKQWGYVVGKLYPDGVGFKEYHPDDENFWGPNYVAVRADDKVLIQHIGITDFVPIHVKRRKKTPVL
jgi:FkbM family methyltransferase